VSINAGPRPVLAASFILELPRDLNLAEGTFAAKATVGGGWGWDPADMPRLPRWDLGGPNQCPDTLLTFRRAHVGIGMPTEATDRCFGDMRFASLSRRQRFAYRRQPNQLARRGAKEWKTVVRVPRWFGAEGMPTTGDELDVHLRVELREGLQVLNEWLSCYGMISGNPHLGTLSPGDLPAYVPFVLEGKDVPENDVAVVTRLLVIHDRAPVLRARDGNPSAAEQASEMLIADDEDKALTPGLSMLYQAQAHLVGGRPREAVIHAGTAVEMLVSAIYRTVSDLRDDPPADKAPEHPHQGLHEPLPHPSPARPGRAGIRRPGPARRPRHVAGHRLRPPTPNRARGTRSVTG
jgi:hypothetical protein